MRSYICRITSIESSGQRIASICITRIESSGQRIVNIFAVFSLPRIVDIVPGSAEPTIGALLIRLLEAPIYKNKHRPNCALPLPATITGVFLSN